MKDSQLCTISSLSSDLHLFSVDEGCWPLAEEKAQSMLCIIQPTVVSDQRRMEIINYIRGLVGSYFGIEVFPFGSVPLKTYLPDGDIDLTAISYENMEEDLTQDLCNFLESVAFKGEKFQVEDIQYIHAQVKIVKCSVQNIAVDISFNQVAGLCALYFLEQADRLVGNGHLFKSSVILIKAWCFYESRILGAHHGLISTYALETMVLLIINLFHRSLHGPLSVLYRFLCYYSTFNWEAYCVSVLGPVNIASFPEALPVKIENCGDELLMSEEFLSNCREMLTIPTNAVGTGVNKFPIKYLNILDPLNLSNNLGRSVSQGNFYRIRRAFAFGAQRLGETLVLPREAMTEDLMKFFVNTLKRNGKGHRADVEGLVPEFKFRSRSVSDLQGYRDTYIRGTLSSVDYLNPTASSSHISNRAAACKGRLEPSLHSPLFSSKAKPRGTGTYIPDIGILEGMKSRGTGAYFSDIGRAQVSRTRKDENGGWLDLSLEEFPHLPSNNEPAPSTLFRNFSPPVGPIVFGNFGEPLQELQKYEGELVPFKLEDDSDFPPLSF